MKTVSISRPRIILILLFGIQLIFSCKKVNDNNVAVATAQSALPDYRIERIETNNESAGSYIATIHYNKNGNPTEVKMSSVSTGSPDLKFLYDEKNNLTDYISLLDSRDPDGNRYVMQWHKYGHDNARNIILDTVYNNVAYKEGSALPVAETSEYATIIHYMYDSEGRMIAAEEKNAEGNSVNSTEYKYNNAGNLVQTGAIYDDKVNINRTNKIWMFINKDYSLNNPYSSEEYNIKNLPAKFDAGGEDKYLRFLTVGAGVSTISYSSNL